MPNRTLEEQNIDENLAHFQQHDQSEPIKAWRQRIENKEARLARRRPHTITIEQAVKDFRQALFEDAGHSETAKALYRELLRPAPSKKLTAREAWRLHNPAHRPASLTLEEQAYVERYDKNEQERRKWCVEISTDRWDRWGVLEEIILDCRNRAEKAKAQGVTEDAKHFTKHAETARNELHADLAKVGEQWMAENPELARKLVDQFIGQSWVKPVPTKVFKKYLNEQFAKRKAALEQRPYFFSEAWAVSGPSNAAPEQAYYKGRLYYIAANLILKHFGLNVEVARSVMEDLREKLQTLSYKNQLVGRLGTLDRSVESYDAAKSRSCDVAAGRVYWDLYEELQKDGIGCIPILERHLSNALRKFLDDPDQVNDRSTISFSTLESDSHKAGEENRDTEYDLDRMLLKQSTDYRKSVDPKPNECEKEQENTTKMDTSMRETILEVFKTGLTPRQKSILLLRDQGHTHQSIAEQLAFDPRTIRREFKKIKDFTQILRAQYRL